MPTISQLFAATVAADPAKPLLTWYDDATGERTELSGATLANWVAKTSNLLVDGCGLGPGAVASIRLAPHWQTAAIMLSCWTAGLAVAHSPDVAADVAFVLPTESATAPDVFAVALHPFAMPVSDLPDGATDWVLSARAHADSYVGPPADPSAAALVGLPNGGQLSHAELGEQAMNRAAELGIGWGDRVLINVDTHRRPLDWLVAPLAAGASLVLCRNATADRQAALAIAERVTVELN